MNTSQQTISAYEQMLGSNEADGFLITNASGEIIWCNHTIEQISGYPKEELIGKRPGQLMPGPETDADVLSYINSRVREKKGFECEVLNYTKTGAPYWAHLTALPIRNRKGELTNFFIQQTTTEGTLQQPVSDVSQKEAFLEEYFQSLLQQTDEGILFTNEEYKVVYANKQLMLLFGLETTPETIYGLYYTEVLQLVEPLLKNEKETIARINKLLKQPDGKQNSVVETAAGTVLRHQHFPVYQNETYKGHIWRFENITNEITQQNVLRRLKELMQKTNAAARIGSWDLDLETETLYWSETTKTIHEVNDGYIPDVHKAIDFYEPVYSRPIIIEKVKQCIEHGIPFEEDLQIITAKGKKLWVRSIGAAEVHDHKNRRIYGAFQDIDQQKKMQLELEQKKEEYSSLFHQNPNPVFALDTQGCFTEINDEALKISGLSREQAIGLNFLSFVPTEKKQEVQELLNCVLQGEKKQYELWIENVFSKPVAIEVLNLPIIVNNKTIGVYGILKDITEKKEFELRLKESNDRFARAVDGSNDFIREVNFENPKNNFISERLFPELGYQLHEIPADSDSFYTSLIHPEDQISRALLRSAYLNGITPIYKTEFRLKLANGTYRWYKSRAKISRNEKGVPERMTGSITDIHEEKMLREELKLSYSQLMKQEQELKEALHMQSAMVNALPDKILKVDEAGIIHYFHVPEKTILFKNRLPVVGDTISTVMCVETGSLLLKNIEESIRTQTLVIFEFKKTSDNNTYYYEARIVPAENKMALVIIRNISQEKHAQLESAQKEFKYNNLIENMKLGLLEVDNNEIITRAHDTFCNLTGYNEEELVGNKASEIFLPAAQRAFMDQVVAKRKAGISDSYEIRMRKKSGEIIDVLISGIPIYDNEGRLTGSAGIHYDITHQKRTDSLLEESIKIGKVGTYELDLINKRATWNRIMCDIYETEPGYSPVIDEIMSFYPEGESMNKAVAVFHKLLNREMIKCDETFEIVTKKGNHKWIRTIAEVEFHENTATRVVGIVIDITDVMKSEQQLKEYASLSETILTSITDGFYVVDCNYRLLFVNDSACQFVGKSREEMIGKNIWELFPITKVYFYEVLEQVRKNKEQQTITGNYDFGNGPIWLNILVYPTRDGGVSVLYRDISAEKQAEESIKNLNTRYRAISTATNQIIYEWNLNSHIVEFNEVFYKVTGYQNCPEVRTSAFNFSKVHPDDITALQQTLEHSLKNKQPVWEASYRYRVANGSYRYMHCRGVLEYDEQGNPDTILGTIEDNTQRVRLNEKLVKEKVNTQRKMNEAFIIAQENERELIGHELHDNVNQILTTASLYMQLAESEAFTSKRTIDEIHALIRKAIEEIRVLSRRLTPPSLKDIGLTVAVKDLVTLLAKASTIEFHLQIDDSLNLELTNERSLVLYRISQELLNNTIKYSEAKNCSLLFEKTDKNHLRILVKDDGKGFDAQRTKKGVGLSSTVARAEVYGGTFEIESSPGQGCCVTVEIPII